MGTPKIHDGMENGSRNEHYKTKIRIITRTHFLCTTIMHGHIARMLKVKKEIMGTWEIYPTRLGLPAVTLGLKVFSYGGDYPPML